MPTHPPKKIQEACMMCDLMVSCIIIVYVVFLWIARNKGGASEICWEKFRGFSPDLSLYSRFPPKFNPPSCVSPNWAAEPEDDEVRATEPQLHVGNCVVQKAKERRETRIDNNNFKIPQLRLQLVKAKLMNICLRLLTDNCAWATVGSEGRKAWRDLQSELNFSLIA